MKRLLPILLVAFLAACASTPPKLEPPDASKPNLASMYYNTAASYLYFSGDYSSADQLYNLSLMQDPGSSQIRKQILMNSYILFLQRAIEDERILELVSATRNVQSFDRDMLIAAYNIYSQLQMQKDTEWALDELSKRFADSQVYVMRFFYEFSQKHIANETHLKNALEKSGKDPDKLLMIAKAYALFKPDKAIHIAKNIGDHPEAKQLLLQLYIDSAMSSEIDAYINELRYPMDAKVIKDSLLMLNQRGRYSQILKHADKILETFDVELLDDLAFSCLMDSDTTIATKIANYLDSKLPEPEADSRIATILLAQLLYDGTFYESKSLYHKIYSMASAHDILLYYAVKTAFLTGKAWSAEDPDILMGFSYSVSNNFMDSPLKSYLLSIVKDDFRKGKTFSTESYEFGKSLIEMQMGDRADFTSMMQYLFEQGDLEERIKIMRIGLNKYPNDALFLNDLGYSLLEYPDSLDEAEFLISRAIEIEPENLYYQDSMAWLLYLKGDFLEAEKHIEKLVLEEQLPAEIQYHIAMIYLSLDKQDAALLHLRKATEAPDESIYKEKAAKLLIELQ